MEKWHVPDEKSLSDHRYIFIGIQRGLTGSLTILTKKKLLETSWAIFAQCWM